uniref:hypothetical protein n=1 Tax=Lactococcus garvieae TaxID=1363 RepID=UPI00359C2AC3
MSKYEELIAKQARIKEEYERSKAQLEKQTERVRKKEQDLKNLEGEIALAVMTEHGLTASELVDLLSDLNAPQPKESPSFFEQGGED